MNVVSMTYMSPEPVSAPAGARPHAEMQVFGAVFTLGSIAWSGPEFDSTPAQAHTGCFVKVKNVTCSDIYIYLFSFLSYINYKLHCKKQVVALHGEVMGLIHRDW